MTSESPKIFPEVYRLKYWCSYQLDDSAAYIFNTVWKEHLKVLFKSPWNTRGLTFQVEYEHCEIINFFLWLYNHCYNIVFNVCTLALSLIFQLYLQPKPFTSFFVRLLFSFLSSRLEANNVIMLHVKFYWRWYFFSVFQDLFLQKLTLEHIYIK